MELDFLLYYTLPYFLMVPKLKFPHLQLSTEPAVLKIHDWRSHLFVLPIHKTLILVHTNLCSCWKVAASADPSEDTALHLSTTAKHISSLSQFWISTWLLTLQLQTRYDATRGLASRCSNIICWLNRTLRSRIPEVYYISLCLLIISRESHSVLEQCPV